MKIVTLVSGGLDSTLMSVLIKEEGIEQFPLLINYGQLNFNKESAACYQNFNSLGLPKPTCLEIPNYGALFPSGITTSEINIMDAFLPCRNLLFLTCAAAFAYTKHANALAIGLLSQEYSIFPDQKSVFIERSAKLLSMSLETSIEIVTPLMSFSKAEVVSLAKAKGISATYSCHAGGDAPCGRCIACNEFNGLEV